MPTFSASGACDDAATNVSYVFSAATPLLDKPKSGALRVGTAPAEAIGMVACLSEGYLRVVMAGKDGPRGWFAATRKDLDDNMLPEGLLNPMLRKIAIEDKPWSAVIKSAILRKRVRIGFTPEQVKAALKDPLRRDTEETAAGVTEVWTYLGQAITFRGGRVTAIRKSQ